MGNATAAGYGIATAAGAGTADFLAKTTTDRVGALSSLWFLQLFGAPFLVGLAVLVDGLGAPPLAPLIGLVLLSVLSVLGLFFLYRAFELGRLSVVAPLTSGYPAMTAVLSVAFLGERLPLLVIGGLAATIAGAALLSTRRAAGPTPPRAASAGVASAFAAFAAFGLFYFGLKFVVGPVPPVTAAAVTRLVGLALVGPVVWSRHRPMWPRGSLVRRAVSYPILDSGSLVVFNLGVLLAGSLAILTAVSGLYGAVTLLWAIVVLRDRPDRIQWTGCGAVFLGVTLLALG